MTCDLRVAAAGMKLGMPPGKLGLIYSHTGIQKFLDTVGPARTRELFFTGRNVDGRARRADRARARGRAAGGGRERHASSWPRRSPATRRSR